jgi:hypothetical protein
MKRHGSTDRSLGYVARQAAIALLFFLWPIQLLIGKLGGIRGGFKCAMGKHEWVMKTEKLEVVLGKDGVEISGVAAYRVRCSRCGKRVGGLR